QAVPAAGGPPGHHADHDLGHEADEALHLEDVQPTRPSGVDGLGGLTAGVLVARAAPDALVAARAERPAAVAGGRAVAGQQHAAHVAALPGVVEGGVE